MRKVIVCARISNEGKLEHGKFDMVATVDDYEKAPSTCPLVGLLKRMPDSTSSHEVLNQFMDLGIVQKTRGPLIYEFPEMPGPCPYTNNTKQQQTEDTNG